MAITSTPASNQGYIKVSAAQTFDINDGLFTEQALIDFGVNGGAQSAQRGCNISFDSFLNVDLNLSADIFRAGFGEFDESLFHKADAISLEMTAINNMLINAILDMGCCDIAGVY
ncbi:MAG: hypothetical protein ABGX14_05715, partial [bacterium]